MLWISRSPTNRCEADDAGRRLTHRGQYREATGISEGWLIGHFVLFLIEGESVSYGVVMAWRYQLRGWPRRPHIFGNIAQVHAFGQVGLAYNFLQDGRDYLFQTCMPTERGVSQRLFHILNNRERIELFAAVVKSSKFHPEAKDRLNYLIQCFDICTDNRNILLHAMSYESYADEIHFGKRSSNNPSTENRFKIQSTALRSVADEIHSLIGYQQELLVWIEFRKHFPSKYRGSLKTPPLNEIRAPKLKHVLRAVPGFGTTLPVKPLKPRKLTPSHLATTPAASKPSSR